MPNRNSKSPPGTAPGSNARACSSNRTTNEESNWQVNCEELAPNASCTNYSYFIIKNYYSPATPNGDPRSALAAINLSVEATTTSSQETFTAVSGPGAAITLTELLRVHPALRQGAQHLVNHPSTAEAPAHTMPSCGRAASTRVRWCSLLAALLGAAMLAAGCGGSTSRRPPMEGTELIYVALPYGSPVTAEKVHYAVARLEQRLKQEQIAASVSSSGDLITIGLPSRQEVSGPALKTSAPSLYFYDWEPNVIGANGKPAPTEATVTGGSDAGSATYGLPEYQAVQRAAERAPILRDSDTTWTPGCTPAQIGGCLYGSWYLINPKRETVLCAGGEATCGPAEYEKELYDGVRVPSGSASRAVRINPGTIIVQARPTESASGKVLNSLPNSFYVLNDEPVLTGADITHPQQGFDEGSGGNGQPNVNFGFTAHGGERFEEVTKKIAHRGQEAQLPGVAREAAVQHFAVILDNQLITAPSIDYTKYPEGIDASRGSEISGGFTITSARELAEELGAALPVRLVLRATRHVG